MPIAHSPRLLFSCSGTECQLNCRFQSNPPTAKYPLCWYWRVSVSMTSMTGQTTWLAFLAILSTSGSSQPGVHSMCESRKVSTGAVALAAPSSRARISPTLSGARCIFT